MPQKEEVNLLHISDLHGVEAALPKVELPYDAIIISGDITNGHDVDADMAFLNGPFKTWLKSFDCPEVHCTPGNHDLHFGAFSNIGKCMVHVNELIELHGLNFYFIPYTLAYSRIYHAFTEPTEDDLWEKHFSKIPDDVDIIVSHSPPAGILDTVPDGRGIGSNALARRINQLSYNNYTWNNRLKAVLSGHVHQQGGKVYDMERMHSLPLTFCNAAMVNSQNEFTGRSPIELTINNKIKWEILPRGDQPSRTLHVT